MNCNEKLFGQKGLVEKGVDAGKRGSDKWAIESDITCKVVLQIIIKIWEDKAEEISQGVLKAKERYWIFQIWSTC